MKKPCARCHEEKELDQFALAPTGKYKRQAWCRSCQAIWRIENPEKVSASSRRTIERNRAINVDGPNRVGSKICKECGEPKPRTDFFADRTHSDGLQTNCATCSTVKQKAYYLRTREQQLVKRKAWQEANKERVRRHRIGRRLREEFGLSISDFDKLMETQGGKCGICQCDITARCTLDHCHATGKVRGLLCTNCNSAIGMLRDDPIRCEAAAKYLRYFLANIA